MAKSILMRYHRGGLTYTGMHTHTSPKKLLNSYISWSMSSLPALPTRERSNWVSGCLHCCRIISRKFFTRIMAQQLSGGAGGGAGGAGGAGGGGGPGGGRGAGPAGGGRAAPGRGA